jgi:hypothetical protein
MQNKEIKFDAIEYFRNPGMGARLMKVELLVPEGYSVFLGQTKKVCEELTVIQSEYMLSGEVEVGDKNGGRKGKN